MAGEAGARSAENAETRKSRASSSLFSFLYRWLLESDLPVALQVFWKLLTFGQAALLVFVAIPSIQSAGGQALLSVLAAASFFGGLFTKLGSG